MFITDKQILTSKPQSLVSTGSKTTAEEIIQLTQVHC